IAPAMFQAARISTQAAAEASSGNIQARGSRSLSAVRPADGGASAPETASELRPDSVISVMAAQCSTKPGRHHGSASRDPKVVSLRPRITRKGCRRGEACHFGEGELTVDDGEGFLPAATLPAQLCE